MGCAMADRMTFTSTWLASRKVAQGDYWEKGYLPGFGVRVGNSGRKTFILATRLPGKAPSRHALGKYGPLTLEQAHAKAKRWLELIEQGKDPRNEESRAREV